MAGSDLNSVGGLPARRNEVDAALRDLHNCVQRIRELIPRVDAVIDRRGASAVPHQAMPRVILGGGPSAFTRRESGRSAASTPAATPPSPPSATAPNPKAQAVIGSSSHLIVVADLALGGYSREQIGERLQAWGGPRVIDDAFE